MNFESLVRPARARSVSRCLVVIGLVATARLSAQVPVVRPDTVRRDTARVVTPPTPDSARARPPRRVRAAIAAPALIRPPISPRRALLYSLAIPGYGQSRLDRNATGAFFVAVEAAALTMVAKSAFDLAEAHAFRGDSLVATRYPVDPATGLPQTLGTADRERSQFTNALVRSRRLHLEDWLATLAFNHLIAGAEAFVSANLWEVQTQISARPSDHGAAVALSLAW